jgi:hypothetical protein
MAMSPPAAASITATPSNRILELPRIHEDYPDLSRFPRVDDGGSVAAAPLTVVGCYLHTDTLPRNAETGGHRVLEVIGAMRWARWMVTSGRKKSPAPHFP